MRSTTRQVWKWIAAAVLIVPAVVALGVLAMETLGGSDRIGPVQGLSLGFGPAQARERLVTEAPGSFRSTAIGEDFALDWTPDADPGPLRRARLEFHLGQLVAARLALTPDAAAARGPALEVSDASVLTRAATPDGAVEITWLARSCPTHAEEVRRVLAETEITEPR